MQTIVLLGAGNANLQVVEGWQKRAPSDVRLILVNDADSIPYSGMLPGWMAGMYRRGELEIDLRALCERHGVQFVQGNCTAVDPELKRLEFVGNAEPMAFDVLALNTGSRPMLPPGAAEDPACITLKPLHACFDRIAALSDKVQTSQSPFRLSVVGGGATGCELALALRRRFRSEAHVYVRLLVAGERLLPGMGWSAGRCAERALHEAGIFRFRHALVTHVTGSVLHLEDGREMPSDATVWTTGAVAGRLTADGRMTTDDRGFMLVDDCLRSESHPVIYGAGDCVTLTSEPGLPRAGVFAVREGPILRENLLAACTSFAPRRYRPQSLFLALMNTCDRRAIMSYGRLGARGRWVRWWKNTIDRRWVRRFQC